MDEEELEEIQAAARRHRMTVSEWVRQSLREARKGEPSRSAEAKLEALDHAQRHSHPTGNIEQILEEIARGALSGAGA